MLAILTVNVTDDNVDLGGVPIDDDGFLTLRDTIAYVNGTAQPVGLEFNQFDFVNNTEPFGTNDTIIFSTDPADGLNGATITLGRDANGDPLPAAPGTLQISESLTIDATALTNGITIDASGTDSKATPVPGDGDGSGVFDLAFSSYPEDIQATFAGLTITGDDTERGGGINLNGWLANPGVRVSLTIVDTVIKNNYASDVGGGVNVYGWEVGAGLLDVNIIRSTIENNTAAGDAGPPGPLGPGDGGGIYVALNEGDLITNTGAVFNLIDSTVANNEATNGDGGGIWFNTDGRGTFNAVNSTISGNRTGSINLDKLMLSDLKDSHFAWAA